MKKDKPFWETDKNPITGYKVESLKDVVNDTKLERVYNLKGKRYCKSTARSKKNRERQLEQCVIINNEE